MNHPATQHTQAAAQRVSSSSGWLNFLPTIFFVGALALAPQPAFAQHGGGGGSHGGGGGGGSHSSGGGSHSGGSASASHGGVASGRVSGGGSYGAHASAGSATASTAGSFNIGTNRWADPPSRGSHFASTGVRTPTTARVVSSSPATHSTFAPASRPVQGHRRFGPVETFQPDSLQIFGRRFPRRFFFGDGACFNGLFFSPCGFGFPFSGFGFGFGPTWFGPWGWDNDGFGFQNYGYPYESSMSADIEARVENQPQYYESAPYGFGEQYPTYEPESAGPPPAAAPDTPLVMLYLRDGTVYALTNYWVAGGRLHYVTQYGGENSVGMDQVDIQRSVDVNGHRGVNITLRPAPDTNAPVPPQ